MTKESWLMIVIAIERADRQLPGQGRRPKYSDLLIVKMYLYGVLHDRPRCWSCDKANYGVFFRPRNIPSVSQFCRRVKTQRIGDIIDHVNGQLSQHDRPIAIASVDGRCSVGCWQARLNKKRAALQQPRKGTRI